MKTTEPMHLLIKYFSEITIKSRPVRLRQCRQLENNMRRMLAEWKNDIHLSCQWEHLALTVHRAEIEPQIIARLQQTPGIANFAVVHEYPLRDFADIGDKTLAIYRDHLRNKHFAVRCRRSGQHSFSSVQVEAAVGKILLDNSEAAGVNLSAPQVKVLLEVRENRLIIVRKFYKGLDGFPLGTMGEVLSLVSGGFDSTLASYNMIRRGLITHFCLFNIGGQEHKTAVHGICHSLWRKYAASHRAYFLSVPFDSVLADIMQHIAPPFQGIVLKRTMLRCAERLATLLGIPALVSGESIGQVSSQTLSNLTTIDRATLMPIFRPLVACHKKEIIAAVRDMGLYDAVAKVPEYCSVTSIHPAVHSQVEKIARHEKKLNATLLEDVVKNTIIRYINDPALPEQRPTIEEIAAPIAGSTIIDVRPPAEIKKCLQAVGTTKVLSIPFYLLHNQIHALKPDQTYLLYCEHGFMSRLQAEHLLAHGFNNIKIYRPSHS